MPHDNLSADPIADLPAQARSLAHRIEQRWLDLNHDHDCFGALAEEIFLGWSPPTFELSELIARLAAPGVVGEAEALSDAESAVPLATTAHFSVDATLWSSMPTLIEQMPHVGALRMMSGELLMCTYAFAPKRRVTGVLELGDLTPCGMRLLRRDDVVRLDGPHTIRALFPITTACAAVVVKARSTRVAPPRRLWQPGVALAPAGASNRLCRLLDALLALGRCDRGRFWTVYGGVLAESDLYDALWLVSKPQLVDWTLEDDKLDDVLLAVSRRHPALAGALPALVDHCHRYACARRLHGRCEQDEHRAVLALLTHRPGRTPAREALRRVFGIDDAGAALSRGVAALAEQADGVATRGLLSAGLAEDDDKAGGRLVVNPKLEVTADGAPTVTGLTITAPIRGRGLRTTWIPADNGWLFDALRLYADPRRDHRLEVPASRIDDLIAIGVLIREDEVSSPDPFEISADPELSRWIPAHVRRSSVAGGTLLVADSLRVTRGPDAPVSLDAVRGDFSLSYHAAPDELDVLARLSPGRPPPPDLDPCWTERWVDAGILFDPSARAAEQRRWATALEQCRAQFTEHGYATLAAACPPMYLAALRRYMTSQIEHGMWELGDEQTPKRFRRHNDPAARLTHEQLHPVVEAIVGAAIKPSYCYSASYRPGARLPIHTDREQCEFSVSMLVDFDPEPDGPSPWPLWLRDPADGKDIRIDQRLGDALIYRGRDFPHYRTTLSSPQVSTSMFLHYVPREFGGPLR